MALKSYDMKRKADGAEFTMRLDEADRAKYAESDAWEVKESKSKTAAKARNLSAPRQRTAAKTAAKGDDEGKGDGGDVVTVD